MYISQIVINGFKTFNAKTTLEFGDGITAVVGPNGCGKTNIVDAIRWVLGEQKYSTLRSARMEDVIFNGAKGTKPTGMCEVYLTVKNDKGRLPVEYSDVEVGRRLYRDGESEYFINRNLCRLKDVSNLFVDTGMGADSYSVIELNMIEQILSETDDGRKFLFEEAAGINKYKNQRRLSIKKFEATKFDLERINDIISEVEAKVKGLNLQLKRFKRHAVLVEKLQNYEIDLGTLRINKYRKLSAPLREKIAEYAHLRETKVTDQNEQESELNVLKDKYSKQEADLQVLRKSINALDDKREDAKQKVLIWQEQNKSAEKDLERLNSETGTNKSREAKFELNIKELDQTLEKLLPQIDDKLAIFKNEQEKFEKLEKTYKLDQALVERIQTERWEIQKTISDNQSAVVSTESTIKERELQKLRLKEKIQSYTDELKKLEGNEIDLKQNTGSISDKIEGLIDERNKSAEQLKIIEKELSASGIDRQSKSVRLDALNNQLQFYREIVEAQSDLPDGVKYIVDKGFKKDGEFEIVSDVLSVDEKYEKAISSALGGYSHSLICKDKNTALQVLEDIQKNQAGKISVIPLDDIEDQTNEMPRLPKSDQIISRASDLVNCDKKYRKITELLLGDVLIVKNFKEAVSDKVLADWQLVDRDGVLYNNNVLINPGAAQGVTIGRKEKIENIQAEIEKINQELIVIDNNLKEFNDQKGTVSRNISEYSNEIDVNSNLLEDSKLKYQKLSLEIESKNQFISDANAELKDIDRSIQELKKSILAIQGKVDNSEKEISSIQRKLDDANEKLEISRKERDDHHQAMQDIRIELLNLENERDNLHIRKKTADSTITEIKERQNAIIEEIGKIKDTIKAKNDNITDKDKELVNINKELEDNQKVLTQKEESFRETYRSIEEIENRIKSEQHSRESILEELKHCEVQIAEYNQSIKAIQEKMLDKYGINIPHSDEIENSEEELIQEIAKLERSIENIGPVNMAVQNEFEEEQKRLEHLTAQRDDLIESEENLRESIDKIDRVARKQFRETFDQIKANFESLFVIFFEGGQGTLELVGDPDPLEADIAIRAQPPGKRNQTLRMLSAGEKSLTAIALLFAIYQYKPSPYCILDEVDAPLDDANVRKFTRALKSFTTDTQFIVVTHNKLTMEAADYLYGVTMERKGVSKLVSVKFD